MKVLAIQDVSEYFKAVETKANTPVEARRRWNRMESFGEIEDCDVPYGEPKTEMNIAVIELKGVVTKEWYDGTLQLMDWLEECERNPNIQAIVLDIDSGGGEATNCDTTSRFIRNNVTKPILAIVNGLCCSAAYYIASACDKIYHSEGTDITGSIGAMITFEDFTKYYEKLGIKIVEVYADGSEEKNLAFQEALKGKYEELKVSLLNPYRDAFVATVKEMRNITDDGHVFKGKTYMTQEAIAIGLIDGQKTYEAVLEEAVTLGTEFYNKNKNTMSKITLQAPNIGKTLGYTAEFGSENGQVSLSIADFKAIEAALGAVQKPTDQDTQNDDFKATISAAISAAVTPLNEKLEAATAEIATLKANAGAAPLVPIKGELQDGDKVDLAKIAAEMNDEIIALAKNSYR